MSSMCQFSPKTYLDRYNNNNALFAFNGQDKYYAVSKKNIYCKNIDK